MEKTNVRDEQNFKVLIVDDERSNLDVLNHLLSEKYSVYISKSGRAALKKAVEVAPDIILLDIIMPDMDGFEVIAELKNMPETRNIPVIFITSQSGVEDEEKGFFLGAVDYITKPFQPSIVKARINTHLQIVQQIRTIERLGMMDALTELPNHRWFDMQLYAEWGRAVREMTPLSLVMLDVDRLKAYNADFGLPQGDLLLQTLAGLFMSSLKRTTDLVARLGGGKFAVILPNTDIDGAVTIAEDIREYAQHMRLPCPDREEPTAVTVSAGVVCVRPTLEDGTETLAAQAVEMLKKAKKAGRNKVCS